MDGNTGAPSAIFGAKRDYELFSTQNHANDGQIDFSFSDSQYPQQPSDFAGHQNIVLSITQVDGESSFNSTEPLPPDYTTHAWLACLLCFWPTAIIAIMKASESRAAFARGDLASARSLAKSARRLVIISWVLGIVSLVIILIILAVIASRPSRPSPNWCCVNNIWREC